MMSDQKSYVPWNKSGPSIYSGSTRIKEPSTSTVKKSTDLTRSRLDSTKKSDYDRNASSKNISSTTSFGDFMQGFRQKSENSRIKPALNKKDTSHPPTSYGLLPRTGSLSRDTSPLRKSESISSASTKFSYNRLYPRTHQRSLSRENLEPVTPSVTVTNYSGKKGSNWNDTTKYNSKSGILKDDVPKYTGRLSFSRDDSLSPRYKISSRTPSREDLSKTSPKYIKSRFLPKNSIEKSQTAAAKISTTKINEPSRRNKELMNALQQQEYERLSRSTSRCSSRTSDDYLLKHSGNDSVENDSKSEKKKEITMISRGTSPAHESTGKNISRPTKSVVANIIENKIPSTRKSVHTMIDKGIQPESSNTSIEVSKNIATPWSSFLDMEFSCPDSKLSDKSKVLSRTNSSNSLSNVQTSHSDSKKLVKSLSPSKSKSIPTKPLSDRKLLPPQIPKSESSSKSLHSKLTFPTNKDFRKSILNMNPDESAKTKQQSKCTDSAGSPDHEIADPDITDISENLTSCSSYHNSCGSRLPQKILNEKLRRSSSRETNITNTSGSDEDMIKRKGKRKVYSGTSPKTSSVSSADEMSSSKSIGVPHVSSIRREGNRTESDAKSFLMRALAPVTNLFKPKSYNSSDNVNWMESGTDTEATNHTEAKHNSTSKGDSNVGSCLQSGICRSESLKQEIQKVELKPISAKIILHRVEPVQNYCWTSENTKASEAESKDSSNFISATEEQSVEQPLLKHNESGEIGWWLDKKGDTPEITESSPNQEQCEKQVTKIRRNNSGNSSWWLSSSDKTNNSDHNESSGITEQKYLDNHKLKHIDSEERPWWLSSSENVSEMVQETNGSNDNKSQYVLTHQNSDEKPWWLEGVSEANINDSNFVVENEKQGYAVCHQDSGEKPWWQEEVPEENVNDDEIIDPEPIGDRASPEGLEMSEIIEGSQSGEATSYHAYSRPSHSFISRHTNIDEVLGCSTQIWSPLVKKISENEHSRSCMEKDVTHPNTPCRNFLQTSGTKNTEPIFRFNMGRLDDATLQLYRDGDYGSYLDLEASISEQQEEFEGFQSNKKNSIVLRTQLSVRVHNIIEKLLTSEGRELRRALFSLKQIFQEDKDLVHEFVRNDGLSCLIKVGSEADQNYLNYILRALGQVMLYVDGMNGVMEHNQTIQWLYSLISSKFRLVVKTALKLLLVFVEYADSNCSLLIKAIHSVDYSEGVPFYHNIMKLLKDFEFADTELLIYAMTLINRILNGVSDQDTFYDQIDPLEEQGLETVIQRYMSKPGTDLDLLQQFQIYEAVLQYEDGEDLNGSYLGRLDDSIMKMKRNRKSVVDSTERRKSRRHSTGNSPIYPTMITKGSSPTLQTNKEDKDSDSSSSQSSSMNTNLRGSNNKSDKATDAGVTPALKRRRERAERQQGFIKEQECTAFFNEGNNENGNGIYGDTNQRFPNRSRVLQNNSNGRDITSTINNSEENQPWMCSTINDQETLLESDCTNDNERSLLLQMKRENTVKDLTQKLANQTILHSPSEENKMNRIGDMSGLISKAKEGLAKSKTKAELLKQPNNEHVPKVETKKSENELRWEELTGNLNRSLCLCDMDFTDLASEDEVDILAPIRVGNGIPPPPPLMDDMGSAPPPPPLVNRIAPPIPAVIGPNFQRLNRSPETKTPIKKNKKTVKLFWKEVRDESVSHVKLKSGFIWDELYPVSVDTQKLEHLFETRARDLITKKQQEMNKNKEIIVLDPKRSNAINIGMTKLPPSRSIKTAILKMDATIMNREGIDKLLTMLPTEEERTKIQDAQAANPDLPLGSAEQFLLTLASISELPARLKLWAFKLDFENSEREIAEPLMDLKQGMEVLRGNYTFRGILSTLLSVGNFLNGNEVKGFQIDYLAKVPEVKDTVHKHSLLHHLCHIVMEKFPNATDLYSEVGAITRASKVDFDELTLNVQRLKSDCKSSWDHLKLIAKHDGSTTMKIKMSDFLADCAERIILLEIIHRRIMNRFHKFLLWLGIPLHQIFETKPNEFCRIVSEFALEYRTTRERVLQQLEKKANHRERNKTRGKMITDVGKFKSKEDRADAELRTLLGSDLSDVESLQGTLPWRRTRRDGNNSFKRTTNGNFTDDDDEILESLVKSATKVSSTRNTPRERKRTRHIERKSLKHSRTRENIPCGRDSP